MTTITITTINQIALCSNLSLTWFFFCIFLALVSFFCFGLNFSLTFPMPITHLRRPALSLFGRFKPKFKTFCGQQDKSSSAHFTIFETTVGLLQSNVYRLNTYTYCVTICHNHPHARNMRDNILIPFAKVQ